MLSTPGVLSQLGRNKPRIREGETMPPPASAPVGDLESINMAASGPSPRARRRAQARGGARLMETALASSARYMGDKKGPVPFNPQNTDTQLPVLLVAQLADGENEQGRSQHEPQTERARGARQRTNGFPSGHPSGAVTERRPGGDRGRGSVGFEPSPVPEDEPSELAKMATILVEARGAKQGSNGYGWTGQGGGVEDGAAGGGGNDYDSGDEAGGMAIWEEERRVIRDLMEAWAMGYEEEEEKFASVYNYALFLLKEAKLNSRGLGSPNPLRTAVAFHLLDRLMGVFGRYQPVIAALRLEFLAAVYGQCGIPVGSPEPDPTALSSPFQQRSLREYLGLTPFFEEQRRLLHARRKYEHQSVKFNEAWMRQHRVLQLSIRVWQMALVDRIFTAWKVTTRRNKSRREHFVRIMQTKGSLRTAFTKWRFFTLHANVLNAETAAAARSQELKDSRKHVGYLEEACQNTLAEIREKDSAISASESLIAVLRERVQSLSQSAADLANSAPGSMLSSLPESLAVESGVVGQGRGQDPVSMLGAILTPLSARRSVVVDDDDESGSDGGFVASRKSQLGSDLQVEKQFARSAETRAKLVSSIMQWFSMHVRNGAEMVKRSFEAKTSGGDRVESDGEAAAEADAEDEEAEAEGEAEGEAEADEDPGIEGQPLSKRAGTMAALPSLTRRKNPAAGGGSRRVVKRKSKRRKSRKRTGKASDVPDPSLLVSSVDNFASDISDGRAYVQAMHSLVPSLIATDLLWVKDARARAEAVIEAATKIGVCPLLTPADVTGGVEDLNLHFVSSIFHEYCNMSRAKAVELGVPGISLVDPSELEVAETPEAGADFDMDIDSEPEAEVDGNGGDGWEKRMEAAWHSGNLKLVHEIAEQEKKQHGIASIRATVYASVAAKRLSRLSESQEQSVVAARLGRIVAAAPITSARELRDFERFTRLDPARIRRIDVHADIDNVIDVLKAWYREISRIYRFYSSISAAAPYRGSGGGGGGSGGAGAGAGVGAERDSSVARDRDGGIGAGIGAGGTFSMSLHEFWRFIHACGLLKGKNALTKSQCARVFAESTSAVEIGADSAPAAEGDGDAEDIAGVDIEDADADRSGDELECDSEGEADADADVEEDLMPPGFSECLLRLAALRYGLRRIRTSMSIGAEGQNQSGTEYSRGLAATAREHDKDRDPEREREGLAPTSLAERLLLLLKSTVIPHATQSYASNFRNDVLKSEVQAVVSYYHPLLIRTFRFFGIPMLRGSVVAGAGSGTVGGDGDGDCISGGSTSTWGSGEKFYIMNLKQWLTFGKECVLTDKHGSSGGAGGLSIEDFRAIFCSVQHEEDPLDAELIFVEFVDACVAVACHFYPSPFIPLEEKVSRFCSQTLVANLPSKLKVQAVKAMDKRSIKGSRVQVADESMRLRALGADRE